MSTIVRTLLSFDLVEHGDQHAEYARDWDAYKAQLAAVEELAPEIANTYNSPLALLDEQVVALVNTAWLVGAEYGERLMKGEVGPSPRR